MGKKIEMLGRIFGDWKIIKELPERGADGSIMWEVQCVNCGKIEKKNGSNLRSGHSSKCKKCSAKKYGYKAIKDLTGQHFGILTVLQQTDERTSTGSVIWLCQCECGNIKKIGANSLKNGTMSCGCLNSRGEAKIIRLLLDNHIPFEVQKKFKDCINPQTNNNLIFDFFVNNKYIIEYDGEQHFQQSKSGGWGSKIVLQEVQFRDNIKNQYCFNNNIPIIRIPYTHFNDLQIEDLMLSTSKFILKKG